MRLGLFAAALLFFGVALAGTAKANLVACNHTGQTIWVAYATEVHHAYNAHGWWKAEDGQCVTLTTANLDDGVTYISAENSNAETTWPGFALGAAQVCIHDGKFDYDLPVDSACPDGYWKRDFARVDDGDPLDMYDPNTTYTFEPRQIPTPAPSATPQPSPSPDTPYDLAFNRGKELFDRGRYAQAITFFSQSAALGHDYQSYFYRGQAKFDLGEYQAALKDADEGVRIVEVANGGAGLGPVFQAEAEWALGLFDSAANDFAKAANDSKGWNNYWIASAVLVMRANGRAGDAAHMLVQCAKWCKRDKSRALTQYLAGSMTAQTLMRRMNELQDTSGLIGYDLYLRKQKKAALPYLKRALTGVRAYPYIVPTPILRAALNDSRN